LAVLGALLVFDILFFVIAVEPLDDREEQQRILISNLNQQVTAKSKQLEQLKIVVEKVEKARTEGDELIEDLTFARRTTYSRLVSELDTAATEAGVEVRERNYTQDAIEGAEEYGAITITATYRGKYESLVRLLNFLDRSERFLIIGSLGATPRAESNELQISMKIDTFLRDL
jgi:hypothetical protein